VAPLGTAVTEDQLRLMWRIHPAPIIALDGDKAGQRAASRVIDLALPLIESGLELMFLELPEGVDPDDLIRAEGKEGMERQLNKALPMAEMLWRREASNRALDTPERIASLQKSLRESVNRIKDKDIRGYYKSIFKQRLNTVLFVLGRGNRLGKTPEKLLPKLETRKSLLATSTVWHVVEMIREMAILGVLLVHRRVVKKFESGLEGFEMRHDGHAEFLAAILNNHTVEPDLAYREVVAETIGPDRVEAILKNTHVCVVPAIKQTENFELASATVEEQMAFLAADRGHRREIEDSELDMDGMVDEGLTWRVNRVNEAVRTAVRFGMESEGDPNEDRAAMSKHLQNLIDGQVWVKKSR
jgi:DNA primase